MSQKEFWENEYHKSRPDLTGCSAPSHVLVHFLEFLERRGEKPQGRALELGFGRGRNAIFLAKKGAEVWGLDFCERACRLAKGRIHGRQYGRRLHLRFGDYSKRLRFPNRFFNLVCDILASTTLDEPELFRLRREIRRVLRPGGYLVFYAPNRRFKGVAKLRRADSASGAGRFVHPESGLVEKFYSTADLPGLCRGLKLTASGTISYTSPLYQKRRPQSYVFGMFQRVER